MHVGGVEVLLHLFLTSSLGVYEWSALRSGRFIYGKEPRYQWNWRLSGPQSRSGRSEEEKNLSFTGYARGTVQPVTLLLAITTTLPRVRKIRI